MHMRRQNDKGNSISLEHHEVEAIEMHPHCEMEISFEGISRENTTEKVFVFQQEAISTTQQKKFSIPNNLGKFFLSFFVNVLF